MIHKMVIFVNVKCKTNCKIIECSQDTLTVDFGVASFNFTGVTDKCISLSIVGNHSITLTFTNVLANVTIATNLTVGHHHESVYLPIL